MLNSYVAFQPVECMTDEDCPGQTCGVHPQRWADGSYKGGVIQGSCGEHVAWVSFFFRYIVVSVFVSFLEHCLFVLCSGVDFIVPCCFFVAY